MTTPSGPSVRHLELRIPPLVVWLVFAGSMALLARFAPTAIRIPAAAYVAVLLAAVGAAIAVAGVRAFRRQRTTVNPLAPERASALVDSGVYRHTRNPMYLGMALALAGWGVFMGDLAALAGVPLFVAYIDRFQIVPEERALAKAFGPAFAVYVQTVSRWV